MPIEEPLQASVLLFILGPDKYKQTHCSHFVQLQRFQISLRGLFNESNQLKI